jgi:hypothetical protein
MMRTLAKAAMRDTQAIVVSIRIVPLFLRDNAGARQKRGQHYLKLMRLLQD